MRISLLFCDEVSIQHDGTGGSMMEHARVNCKNMCREVRTYIHQEHVCMYAKKEDRCVYSRFVC